MSGRIVSLHAGARGFVKDPRPLLRVDRGGAHGDRHHGRDADRSLLLVREETYQELARAGIELPHGSLGENVVVAGLPSRALSPGVRLRLGAASCVATGPCSVCHALARVDARLPRAVYGRRGDYLRVESEAVLAVGDPVEVQADAAADAALPGAPSAAGATDR